jgi:hypothetical protein
MYREACPPLSAERVAGLRALVDRLDIRPGPGGSRISDYAATQALVELHLRDVFPGRWTRAMVVALYPSSQLVAHCDPSILPSVRYHIPLQVNDGCWVFSGGHWDQLSLGHVYAMHPHEIRGAVNWGATLRLHLAVDHVD